LKDGSNEDLWGKAQDLRLTQGVFYVLILVRFFKSNSGQRKTLNRFRVLMRITFEGEAAVVHCDK
jgi:hypothetical protein